MNQNNIRRRTLKHVLHAAQHAAEDVAEALTVLHQRKVIVRPHTEERRHTFQHLPVLGGEADLALNGAAAG